MSNLQHLTIHFHAPNFHPGYTFNCRQAVFNLLKSVLHRLSQQLRVLRLRGRFLLSPELFWPGTHAKLLENKLFWPSMEEIVIEAGLTGLLPDPWLPEVLPFSELVTHASRAMLWMPKLKCFDTAFFDGAVRGLRRNAPRILASLHSPSPTFSPVFMQFQREYRWTPPAEVHENWAKLCSLKQQVLAQQDLEDMS